MFSSTMRKNLDPLDQHADEEVWEALKMVKLDGRIRELAQGLYSDMGKIT